ncbi:MAG TPA: response regulator [Alphaproteobacteria bacterium]|nr:response regulator [Alphaproteobacteria bacterium]
MLTKEPSRCGGTQLKRRSGRQADSAGTPHPFVVALGTLRCDTDYFNGGNEIKNQLGGTGHGMKTSEQAAPGGYSGTMGSKLASEMVEKAQRDLLRPPRILVVEDETWIAIELQRALTDGGYEVVGLAADADSAVRLAGERRPVLVLMDIHLAGRGDGIEAASRIRERFGIRSIFLSGHLDTATRRRIEATQPLAMLDKPVTPPKLLATIASVLAGARR